MIENIHSHEGEEQQTNQIGYAFKPPKNIKQIGESTSQKKIYVEDYVFTYIKELVKKEYSECRIAVLLGHYIKMQDSRIILINGAVEAEGIQYDAESVFNNDTWTSIYENIKRYFNDVEVVGWCIGGPGFILENDEKLKKIHLDNFAGVDKALLKYDSLEGEEAFYIYEHGTLSKQSGYYIYYEKNEDMQNYIMEHKSYRHKTVKEKEETAVKEYKEEIKEQKAQENNKSVLHLMYAAGSLMVVIVIVVFAVMINNGNKIKVLEESISEINTIMNASLPVNQGDTQRTDAIGADTQPADSQVVDSSTGDKQTLEIETISGSLNSIKEEEVIGDKAEVIGDKVEDATETSGNNQVPSEQVDSQGDSVDEDTQKSSAEQTDEEVAVTSEDNSAKESEASEQKESVDTSAEVKYYEVQKGDTLVGISFKLYNSGDYVTKIMQLNGIEDMDMIYYGQKLIVP